MDKKNYLPKEEFEVWKYIKEKEIVDSELIRQIYTEISENKKNKILHFLWKRGFLRRARKDLYYNPLKLKDFHKLALRMHPGYIGLGSALRHYNLIEYEDFTIIVMTKKFRKKIAIKGANYEIQFIPLGNLFFGFEKSGDAYFSSVEKTFFDCFLKPNQVGFSNLTKALYDAKIDWKKFIGFFKFAENRALHQRTGYILELMKKETKFRVPEFVFEFLSKKAMQPVKLSANRGKSSFNKKWNVQDNLGKGQILSWWY